MCVLTSLPICVLARRTIVGTPSMARIIADIDIHPVQCVELTGGSGTTARTVPLMQRFLSSLTFRA